MGGPRVRRREFITLLGAAAWPCQAQAQPAMPTIGYVSGIGGSQFDADEASAAFRAGLAGLGFTEGRNLAIDFRWTEGHYERLPKIMVDLVRRQVSAIFTVGGDIPTLIAKGATRTIPIVFLTASDPVTSGLVASLNRPGVNATGVTLLSGPLAAKRLQLLHELVPQAAIGLLVNPNNTNSELESAAVQAAGSGLDVKVYLLEATNDAQVDKAFADLVAAKAGALLVNADPLFVFLRARLLTLAARHAMPAMYYSRAFAQDGGLISYGANVAAAMHQCGSYVGRVLKGENPAELPVVQPTKFELVINLKTAKTLGLPVPPTLLAAADEVIE
jgi:putative ABC transport system substrate-binding protein